MKTVNHFLRMAATIVVLHLAAQAGDPVLSPRAAQLQHESRKVAGTSSTADVAKDQPAGSPKASDLAHSLRTVPSTGPTIDLVHASRPTLSPKDPQFEAAWRENSMGQFQVAPLK